MSESIDLEFNQIEEDPVRDYNKLLQRLSVDIFALRTSTGATENAAQLSVAPVIFNGAGRSVYDVRSDRADTAIVTYNRTDEPDSAEQLSFFDGTLWHIRHGEAVEVLPTLEGIRLAVAMSLAHTAASGPDKKLF
jgi:hypothetical protein